MRQDVAPLPYPTFRYTEVFVYKGILSMVAAMCMAATAQADISVTGTGTVAVPPDMATISVGVVTENVNPHDAMRLNNLRVSAIFKTLGKHDIDKKCFETTNFSIRPKYVYKNNEQPRLIGYIVNNTVNVKVHNLDKVGDVLGDVVNDGANQVGSIQFGVSKMSDALNAARSRATADALRKAKLYCESLDVKVGSVVSITESNVTQPRYKMYAMREMARSADRVPISAGGDKNISVNVRVVFKIEADGNNKFLPLRNGAQPAEGTR